MGRTTIAFMGAGLVVLAACGGDEAVRAAQVHSDEIRGEMSTAALSHHALDPKLR
jgi:hypothetical protein